MQNSPESVCLMLRDLIDPIQETIVAAQKQRKEERTISWKEKMLYDQFLRQTKEVGSQDI